MEELRPILIETNNFRNVYDSCEDALLNQRMLSTVAPPGYGKTTSCLAFQTDHENCVYYISLHKSDNKPGKFYSRLVNLLSDYKYTSKISPDERLDLAVENLKNKGRNMLLIIDQCNKFKPHMLEYLHEFRDKSKTCTGIVLSGTLEFRKDLEARTQHGISGIPEFYDRIEYFKELAPLEFDEIVSYIEARGIFDKEFLKECLDIKKIRGLEQKADNYLRDKYSGSLYPNLTELGIESEN